MLGLAGRCKWRTEGIFPRNSETPAQSNGAPTTPYGQLSEGVKKEGAGMTKGDAMRKLQECGHVDWDTFLADGAVSMDGCFDADALEAVLFLMRDAVERSGPPVRADDCRQAGQPPRR